jgi:hypothetical protein
MFTGTFNLRPGTKMNTDNVLSADIVYTPNNRGGSSCDQLHNNIMKLLQDNQLLVKRVHARCRTISQDVIMLHDCFHTAMKRGVYKNYITLQILLYY